MLQIGDQRRRDSCPVNGQHLSRPSGDDSRRLNDQCRRPRPSIRPDIWPRLQISHLAHQHFERLDANRFDRGETFPLIGEWLHGGWIEENGRSALPTLPLQRQSDEIPERPFGHEVLCREQAVVARKIKFGANSHRLTDQVKAQPAGSRGSNLATEEHPDVASITRPRAFQECGNSISVRRIEVGECVKRPAGAIEVTDQQTTRVTQEQRINPDVELTSKVALYDLIAIWNVFAVGSSGIGPAASNGRAPSRLPGSLALPCKCMDVVPPNEEGPKEDDLLLGARILVDADRPSNGRVCRVEQRRLCRSSDGARCSLVESKKIAQSGVLRPKCLHFRLHLGLIVAGITSLGRQLHLWFIPTPRRLKQTQVPRQLPNEPAPRLE